MLTVAIIIIVLLIWANKSNKKPVAQWHTPMLRQLLTQHIGFYNNLSDADKKVFEQKTQHF